MLKDFKAFVLRGNVVELAVGVVMGLAFGAVITALVTGILTPLISAVLGGSGFANLEAKVGDATLLVGAFLDSIIAFLLTAAAIFFLVVKPVNALMSRHKTEPEVETTT